MLSTTNIRKSYGATVALDGVSIQLDAGQIVALIGPSGSGKTSILRTLAFLEKPDSGTIEFEGVSYAYPFRGKRQAPKPWPKATAVFQQHFLWPHMTLRKNASLAVRDPVKLQPGGMLDQLVDLFELEHCIDRYPNQASLGQRQRAALIRALMLEPKYLLLDEITSALDVEQVGLVLQYLQNLRNNGVGILLITHLIGFARRAADRVYFLENGKVLESGGSELLTNPTNPRVRTFLDLVESAT